MACSKVKTFENDMDTLDIKVHYIYHGMERCGLTDVSFSDLYTMDYCEFSKFLAREIPQLARLDVMRISFLDDEKSYVDLTPRNFHRFVRLSTYTFKSNNPRINIKVLEGSSPLVKADANSEKKVHGVENNFISKRSLDFNSAEYKKQYKSPVELDIELKNRELKSKQNELDRIKHKYNDVWKEYNSVHAFQDTSKSVCTKCHLRLGHTRNRCHMEECTSATICGQVDRHPSEKKELQELAKTKNKLEGEVKAIISEVNVKEKNSNDIHESFESKTHDVLIRSNPEKYITENNRSKEGIVLADSYILKQFYCGKNPDKATMENDSELFGTIITSYEEKLKRKPVKNSVTSLLERSGVKLVNDQTLPSTPGLICPSFPHPSFQWAPSHQNLQYFQQTMPQFGLPFQLATGQGYRTTPVSSPPPPSMNLQEQPPLPPDASVDSTNNVN